MVLPCRVHSFLFSPFSLITFVWWSFCCVLIFTLHVAAFPTCGTNYESCQGPSDPLQTPKVHICAVWLVIRHSRRARVCCMCEQAAVVKGEEKTSRTTLKHESSSMSAQNEEDRRCTAFSMVVSHMRYNMSEKWILSESCMCVLWDILQLHRCRDIHEKRVRV